jgi:hypothetical protein
MILVLTSAFAGSVSPAVADRVPHDIWAQLDRERF